MPAVVKLYGQQERKKKKEARTGPKDVGGTVCSVSQGIVKMDGLNSGGISAVTVTPGTPGTPGGSDGRP